MTVGSQLQVSVASCGCLHEVRGRIVDVWRCGLHDDRYVRVEAVWPWRRCESCRHRVGRYRVTFGDRTSWLLCFECEPRRSS